MQFRETFGQLGRSGRETRLQRVQQQKLLPSSTDPGEDGDKRRSHKSPSLLSS